MARFRFAVAGVVVLSLAGLTACGEGSGSGASPPVAQAEPVPPSILVVNKTFGRISDVMITGPNLPISFAQLDSGQSRKAGHRDLEIPDDVELQFKDASGQRHYRRIDFHGISRTRGGTIRLTILGPDKIDMQTY